MSFQMYLTPPVKFKTSDHDRFIQKLEKFKKHRQEFRTPEKQITQNLIRTRSKKKSDSPKSKIFKQQQIFNVPCNRSNVSRAIPKIFKYL